MSNSIENQLLGDWTYELSMEELAKVGGGYDPVPPGWETKPEDWRVIGNDSYGNPIHQWRFGDYGALNW